MPKVKIAVKPKLKTLISPVKKLTLSPEKIEESIRLKAYELFILRQGKDGNPVSDWLKAEKLILRA